MAIQIPAFDDLAVDLTVGYTYQDLRLSFEQRKLKDPMLMNIDPLNATDINVDQDKDAILNSLYNLFSTEKGERFLFPEFGSSLKRYLFTTVDDFTAKALGDDILRTIETFEPRINVNTVRVIPDYTENLFKVYISFTIISTNTDDTVGLAVGNGSQEFVILQSN